MLQIEELLSPVFKIEVPTVMADTAYTKSHFLVCPREVRDMIYNLVLVGDSEIVPYPGIWEFEAASKSHPSPALLAVSKQLAYEARPILYGKNQWRLPAHTEYGLSIFSLHRLLFRDVTAFFDGRDLPDGDRAELALNCHSLPDSCFRVKDVEAAKARQIHSTYLTEISYIWSRKHALLDGMRQLRSLLINVEGLVCPSGCCRYKVLKDNLYQAALRELSRDLLGKRTWRYFQWSSDFPSIRFVGLLSEAERTLIHDTYGFPRTEAVEEAAEEEKDSEED